MTVPFMCSIFRSLTFFCFKFLTLLRWTKLENCNSSLQIWCNYDESRVWLTRILTPHTWHGDKGLYIGILKRVQFLCLWYFVTESKYYFNFSPLKLSSSNWSVSSAADATSSFTAVLALLSMADCLKIYIIVVIVVITANTFLIEQIFSINPAEFFRIK